ncbi:MAG: TFIIB-type zinc ribbon-containing protein [Terriglobia bacterium]
MPGSQQCPICGETSDITDTNRDTYLIDCPRCGKFEIAWEATVSGATPDILPQYLSAGARQATEAGRRLKIIPENLREIAELHQRTTVSEKLNKLLEFLAKKTKVPGSSHVLRHGIDYPLVDARDEKELVAYLNYLGRKGMLKAEATGRGPGEVAYQLTIDGWRQLEPVLRPGGEAGRCFVASWLDDQMDEPYWNGIEPAVRACGYTPVWMKDIPENKGITDRILSEIRRAEFIVADFTAQRQSVYFEAGFARGLGREVISCCSEDDIRQLHFDTKHFGHLVWKDSADLREKLTASIRTNIIKKA